MTNTAFDRAKAQPLNRRFGGFANGPARVRLRGTLSLPPGVGRIQALVLISGAEPRNRDEIRAGHPLFRNLAQDLANRGIAVLRYDRRGVGSSTGSYRRATRADVAGDVGGAIAYLASRRQIDSHRIDLIGYDKGVASAMIVADNDPRVAFVVLLAAPGVPANPPPNGDPARAASDWRRFNLSHDPAMAPRRQTRPILVLEGSADPDIPPDAGGETLKEGLRSDSSVEVDEVPGLAPLPRTVSAKDGAGNGQTGDGISRAAPERISSSVLARPGQSQIQGYQ